MEGGMFCQIVNCFSVFDRWASVHLKKVRLCGMTLSWPKGALQGVDDMSRGGFAQLETV